MEWKAYVGRGAWKWLGALLAALVLASGSAAADEAGGADAEMVAEALLRGPAIRHIDPKNDREEMARIRHFRNKLPEEFRFRNNFAWARADVRGLRKKEYFAHSRIQNLDGFSAGAAKRIRGISLLPPKETARFKTLFVDYQGNVGGPRAIPRHFDTEYKILEDIAARLSNPSAEGRIVIYTDLEPCPSCRGVMDQFLAAYTNVQMEVLYDWP